MIALAFAERLLFASSRGRFLALLFALMLVKSGLWAIPNLHSSIRIAENPFILWEFRPHEQYIFTSWLAPFLAWTIGATSPVAFMVLHVAFAMAFTLLFAWLTFSRLPEDQARIAMMIFAALPVSATAYFWVGNDGLTLLLFTAALAARAHPVLAALAGLALGLQHFEQSTFAFAALAVASALTLRFGGPDVFPWRTAAATLAGVIAGKLLLMLIFRIAGMAVVGREGWVAEYVTLHIAQFWFHSQYMVWSALGLGWLVAIRFADCGRWTIPFFLCLLGLMPLMMIVNDQTRVIANVTYPLIFAFWLSNPRFLGTISWREAGVFSIIWVLVPWGWVYEGIPTWSAFPYNIVYSLSRLSGLINLPGGLDYWPFRGH